MNEIIRKTILSNFVNIHDPTNDSQELDGEWYAPKWGCDTLEHVIDDIEALAILPPEGETRVGLCRHCGQPRNEHQASEPPLCPAENFLEKQKQPNGWPWRSTHFEPRPTEPAPSSEKEFRAFVEKVAETGPRTGEDARDWQREAQYLLASSPAPSNKGEGD